MRVVEVTRFGGPEVLVPTEAADPVAAPGQVVVDVSAADVLFVETRIRRGGGGRYFDVTPPYVPGGGVAGRVRSVGEGIDPGWVGRPVVTSTAERGGYAEQVAVPSEGLIPVPDGVDLREAAALLHDGNTAFGLLEGTGIEAGEWVLVTAAGGGLGILLVQLARVAGARAIGGAGPDVVFDGAGGQIGLAAFEATARGGRFSAHGAASGGFAAIDPQEAERRGVTVRGIEQVRGAAPEIARRRLERALAEAAAGRIRPVIGQTFPLERAADAHAAIESRDVLGKTLLVI